MPSAASVKKCGAGFIPPARTEVRATLEEVLRCAQHSALSTMLKAIAFDLWETLITDTPEQSRLQERLRLDRMSEILAARGLGVTTERIEHAYRVLWHRCQELYWSADVDVPCRRQIEH